jgi:hypothetical protein
MAATDSELLSLRWMARRLGVKPGWLADEAQAGRVPGVKAGATWLFDADAVETALMARAGAPSPAATPSLVSLESTATALCLHPRWLQTEAMLGHIDHQIDSKSGEPLFDVEAVRTKLDKSYGVWRGADNVPSDVELVAVDGVGYRLIGMEKKDFRRICSSGAVPIGRFKRTRLVDPRAVVAVFMEEMKAKHQPPGRKTKADPSAGEEESK